MDIKNIYNIYLIINEKVKYDFNDKLTRIYIKYHLEKLLYNKYNVICDESNNSIEIIDKQIIIATIHDPFNSKYINLEFGNSHFYNNIVRFFKIKKIKNNLI